MANTGVRGRIVDTNNNPLQWLEILAYDVELGRATTLALGDYLIIYPTNQYGSESGSDIHIRVLDPVKCLLYGSVCKTSGVIDTTSSLSLSSYSVGKFFLGAVA